MINQNQSEYINSLAKKWQDGTISEAEKKDFLDWYNSFDDILEINSEETREELELRIYLAIIEKGNIKTRRSIIRWPGIAAAILCVAIGGYLFFRFSNPTQQTVQAQMHDVAPGSNKATLTLANGQKIPISNATKGKLARQGNTFIQIGAGAVTYVAGNADANNSPEVAYNTLTTQKGEQYPLFLADGTKVWLNSASSITYPVAFSGKERKVKITGEAYFEVIHNASKPFSVEVGGQTIEDIGTSFNINAYTDEPTIKTTLLNGSIKLIKGTNESILKPGEQAVTQPTHNEISIKDINTGYVTAWKDGFFRFDNEDLPTIMRQFSRWYDIQVIYEGPMQEHEFVGKISRNSNLSKVLRILALGGVKYRIEGKRLIIHP